MVGIGRYSEGTLFDDKVADIPNHGYDDFNPEVVMALNPDLIILNEPDDYEKASKVAPTVVLTHKDFETNEEEFLAIANALNKTEQAQKIVNDFKAKLQESKKKLEEAGLYDKTITVINFNSDDQRSINTPQHVKGAIFFQDLGLKAPEAVESNIFTESVNNFISMEAIPKYCDADILWEVNNYDYVVPESNTVWYSLPVVLNGGLLTSTNKAFNSSDYVSKNAQLDEITTRLLEWVPNQ